MCAREAAENRGPFDVSEPAGAAYTFGDSKRVFEPREIRLANEIGARRRVLARSGLHEIGEIPPHHRRERGEPVDRDAHLPALHSAEVLPVDLELFGERF